MAGNALPGTGTTQAGAIAVSSNRNLQNAMGHDLDRNDLAWTMEKVCCNFTIYAAQTGSRTSGHACNKMLYQSTLFISAQSAFVHVNHNNSFSELSGTATFFIINALNNPLSSPLLDL